MDSKCSHEPRLTCLGDQPPRRSIALDVLRAVACILVIARHISFPENAHAFFRAAHRGGWVGVELFFVLSGFLVSGLLFQEYQRHGTVNARQFLIRRGLKIYPAFYAFILGTYGLGLIAQIDSLPPVSQLASELLFVQNYFRGIWGHSWSLAVEEHFYLGIVACVVILLRRRTDQPFRCVPHLFMVTAVVVLAGRIRNSQSPYSAMTHHFPTHLRIDSLAFGVLLSYYWNFHRASMSKFRSYRWIMLAGGLALLSPPFVWTLETTPAIYTVGLSAIYIGSGMILITFVIADLPANWFTRGTAIVGSYSYSIYLWHITAIFVVSSTLKSRGSTNPSILLIACITVSVVAGIVAARIVEFPVLRLRDRLFPTNR